MSSLAQGWCGFARIEPMEITAIFVNMLMGVYSILGSFGWAVVIVSIFLRLIVLPLVIPGMKAGKKMRDLQPKLKELQTQYKDDKKGLANAQMEFYKKHGINPLSGCLPQILTVAVLLLFLGAFNKLTDYNLGKLKVEDLNKQLIPALQVREGFKLNMKFGPADLTMSPAKAFATGNPLVWFLPIFFLLGSAVTQFLSAKMMMPNPKLDEKVVNKATPGEKEDDMMAAMRTQSMYMMPAMSIFIGWSFSTGLVLYWFISSLLSVVQQLIVEKVTATDK